MGELIVILHVVRVGYEEQDYDQGWGQTMYDSNTMKEAADRSDPAMENGLHLKGSMPT